MNAGTMFGAVRAIIRIRCGSLLRIVLGAFVASGLASAVTPAWAAPPQFTGFIDPNKVVIANSPAKVAYLGAGTGDTSWITRYTDNSWVGSEFGFDAGRTDLDSFRKTTPYSSSPGFKRLLAKGRIVDMVTGFVGEYNGTDPALGRDVIAVVVLEIANPGGTINYEIHALGPMDEGFSSSIKVTGFSTGSVQPKIALAGQSGVRGQRTATILVAGQSDTGQLGFNKIDSYRVSFVTTPGLPSLIPNIPAVMAVASYRTPGGQYILDIAHRPSHEGLYRSAASPSASGQSSITDLIFLTAEAVQKGPGTDRKYRPVIYAHVLNSAGNFVDHVRLNAQGVIGQTGIGPADLQIGDFQLRSGKTFDLLYDVFKTNDDGKPGFFIALRSNNKVALGYYDPGMGLVQAWRWSNSTVAQCESTAGLGEARNGAIDFRAFQSTGSRFNANNIEWRLVCVKPNNDLGFGTNARLGVEASSGVGINLGNNNMITRAFGHIGQSAITSANFAYSDPQVFLEFPCLEILQAVDVYRPSIEGEADEPVFRGDECSAKASEVTKGNKDDGVQVGSPGNVSFTVLAAESAAGSGNRRLADVLWLLHGTYAVAEKTTEVVQTKVKVGTDGKKNKKDEKVEVTAFAGAPYIGNPWPAEKIQSSTSGTTVGAMRTLARLPANGQVLTIDLDPKFDSCWKSGFSLGTGFGQCNPERVATKPIPVAVLFAPPFVGNSGQEPNTFPSTYGRSIEQEASDAKTTGGSASVSVGLEFETNAAEGTFMAGYENATGQSEGSSRSTTLSSGFLPPSSSENYVVYQSTKNYRFTGKVIYSSDGFGFSTDEEPFELYVPYSTADQIDSWSTLQALEPDYFGEGRPGSLYPGFAKLFRHVAGDPGSYPEYTDGQSLQSTTGDDARCLGLPLAQLDPTERIVTRRNSPALNAFVKSNVPSAEDALLVGPELLVRAREGADSGSIQAFSSIELGLSAEKTYHEEHTLSFDFESAFGPEFGGNKVRFRAGFGTSVSEGIEQSYSTGQGSQFETQISDLPFTPGLFPNEENYAWRAYLCTADIGTAAGLPPLAVSVLGYTVNDYGGLGNNRFEPLGEITLVHPLGFESTPQPVSRNPLVVFDQPEGTIMRYELMYRPVRTNSTAKVKKVIYCDTEPGPGGVAKKACSLPSRPDRVQLALTSASEPLDKGTTYQWWVSAVDHKGDRVTSTAEFFKTDSAGVPPQPNTTVTPTKLGFTVFAAPQLLFGQYQIETRLTTANTGVPVAGQPVTVLAVDKTDFAARSVCSAVTNADGRARCNFSGADARARYFRNAGSFRARYLGEVGKFGGSEVSRLP